MFINQKLCDVRQILFVGGIILFATNPTFAAESTKSTSQVATTRLHRECLDESSVCVFVDPLNGFTKKWQTKLLHHNFCLMITCHGSCAQGDNPCGYAMFYGSIRHSSNQGCAAGHHGESMMIR